jgi:pyocin large subunit-like protein
MSAANLATWSLIVRSIWLPHSRSSQPFCLPREYLSDLNIYHNHGYAGGLVAAREGGEERAVEEQQGRMAADADG